MKSKHSIAYGVLGAKLAELGGRVFSRWVANQNEETKKTAEAVEFFDKLTRGEFKKDEDEYLQPYLEQFYELNKSMNVLLKDEVPTTD